MTVAEKARRAHHKILVLAVEAAERQTKAERVADRDAWVVARWSHTSNVCDNVGRHVGERSTQTCTDRWPREPRRWCKTCIHAAQLVAIYERLAPPAWRVRGPERATGPVIVRVKVDLGTPSGMARPGQARVRVTKDGRCWTCRGSGMTGVGQICTSCEGSGGRRYHR